MMFKLALCYYNVSKGSQKKKTKKGVVMRSFKHHNGSTVYVDENGKKTIVKYGLKFTSFAEIKRFEYEVSNAGIKLTDEEINVMV